MPPHGSQWSHEDLVDSARDLGDELGRSPTTAEAAADDRFPCLSTIYKYADENWLDILEDAGLEETQVLAYGEAEEPRMCRDLVGAYMTVTTPHLTHRQYDDLGVYPTSVVKKQFGSWREACNAAGVPVGEKHGTICEGPKGEKLQSSQEKRVATALFDRDVEYVPHPPIEGTDWIADFYLPEQDLWIEVDGYPEGTRPNETGFDHKIEHLRDTGDEVVVIKREDEPIEALLLKSGL